MCAFKFDEREKRTSRAIYVCMSFLSVPFPPQGSHRHLFFLSFPDLLSKPEAKYIFGEVVSEHNSGSGYEDEDMGMSSPDKQKPGLSFEGYLWCLAYVAIESALWPIEDKNGSGPGPSEEHQVFALLQWMDRSSGKKKLARNGRCSAVIGPFRSTVKTPRKKNSQERYKSC